MLVVYHVTKQRCQFSSRGMHIRIKRKGSKRVKSLKSVSLPAVVFWNFNHFLVLEEIKNGQYWINDPATGRRCLNIQEFDRCYTGDITMQPNASFQTTPKPSVNELIRWLNQGSKVKRWVLLFTISISAGLLSHITQVLTSPELWPLIGFALAVIPMGNAVSQELNDSTKSFKNSSSAFQIGSFNSTSAMNWQDD